MKKTRYSDEQIISILREADQGKLREVAKRYGVSKASMYVWRKRLMGTADRMVTNEFKMAK
jgi:putative transposase